MNQVNSEIIGCPKFEECNADTWFDGSPQTGFTFTELQKFTEIQFMIIGERPGLRSAKKVRDNPKTHLFTGKKWDQDSYRYFFNQFVEWANVSPLGSSVTEMILRQSVLPRHFFYTNVFKCPTYSPDKEIDLKFLRRQIEFFKPKGVMLLGNVAKENAGPILDELDIPWRHFYHPSFYGRRGGKWKEWVDDASPILEKFINEVSR